MHCYMQTGLYLASSFTLKLVLLSVGQDNVPRAEKMRFPAVLKKASRYLSYYTSRSARVPHIVSNLLIQADSAFFWTKAFISLL